MLFNVAVLPLLAVAGSAIAAPHRMNVVHIPFPLARKQVDDKTSTATSTLGNSVETVTVTKVLTVTVTADASAVTATAGTPDILAESVFVTTEVETQLVTTTVAGKGTIETQLATTVRTLTEFETNVPAPAATAAAPDSLVDVESVFVTTEVETQLVTTTVAGKGTIETQLATTVRTLTEFETEVPAPAATAAAPDILVESVFVTTEVETQLVTTTVPGKGMIETQLATTVRMLTEFETDVSAPAATAAALDSLVDVESVFVTTEVETQLATTTVAGKGTIETQLATTVRTLTDFETDVPAATAAAGNKGEKGAPKKASIARSCASSHDGSQLSPSASYQLRILM
ncbi:hypothetical protein K438DRAFT_1766376 [Mycena galopus ATCC 62051]|nr:hypothetical protein K438DRAFT_1766376 [Mycena galopus ATCC 62051]